MERVPKMILQMHDGSEFEAKPENTSLFRFMGHLAIYNHVFAVTSEEDSKGMYVFSLHEVFPRMEQYMIENNYPVHDNLRHVAECDMNAYDQMIAQQVSDLDGGVPESWND